MLVRCLVLAFVWRTPPVLRTWPGSDPGDAGTPRSMQGSATAWQQHGSSPTVPMKIVGCCFVPCRISEVCKLLY